MTKKELAQVLLNKALADIRQLGLAPVLKWARCPKCDGGNEPHKMAVNIADFTGFHELPKP